MASCSGRSRHLARRSPGIKPATFLLPDNCSYLLSYCHPCLVHRDRGHSRKIFVLSWKLLAFGRNIYRLVHTARFRRIRFVKLPSLTNLGLWGPPIVLLQPKEAFALCCHGYISCAHLLDRKWTRANLSGACVVWAQRNATRIRAGFAHP